MTGNKIVYALMAIAITTTLIVSAVLVLGCATPTQAVDPGYDRTNAIQNGVEYAIGFLKENSPYPVDDVAVSDVGVGLWYTNGVGSHNEQFIDVRMNFVSKGQPHTAEVIVLWVHGNNLFTVNYADVDGKAI
jgi:hypothetical protein